MKQLITAAAIALALGAAPVITAAPAAAAVDLSISLGNAAFGYADGYWDRDHHWHAWRNKQEAQYFREHYMEHFYNVRHDRDKKDRDMGWRNERWWEEHH